MCFLLRCSCGVGVRRRWGSLPLTLKLLYPTNVTPITIMIQNIQITLTTLLNTRVITPALGGSHMQEGEDPLRSREFATLR